MAHDSIQNAGAFNVLLSLVYELRELGDRDTVQHFQSEQHRPGGEPHAQDEGLSIENPLSRARD